jgi:hypothetical protein
MIHSLGELLSNAERGYFVYLLDYGWDEPLGEALRKNFAKMAELASPNNAVVLQGVVGSHFQDEVLSWHHVNGLPGEELLPAIMITTRNPHQFRQLNMREDIETPTDRMILIPLRKVCNSSTDVAVRIEKIFRDIKQQRALTNFQVVQKMKQGKMGAIVDALILEPNVAGVGINLHYIINFFRRKQRN